MKLGDGLLGFIILFSLFPYMFTIFINKKVVLKVLVLKLDLRAGFLILVEWELRGKERNHRRLYCQLLPYLDHCGQKAPPSPHLLRQGKGSAILGEAGGGDGVVPATCMSCGCPSPLTEQGNTMIPAPDPWQ